MALKISASDFLTRRSLSLDAEGIVFRASAFPVDKKRRIRFGDIDCILLSRTGVLSVQMGREVFSIPTKHGDGRHQELINALVREVRAGAGT